jgi:hypothetical protein
VFYGNAAMRLQQRIVEDFQDDSTRLKADSTVTKLTGRKFEPKIADGISHLKRLVRSGWARNGNVDTFSPSKYWNSTTEDTN